MNKNTISPQAPRSGERGFSLVELMVAMTVLGIGVMSLAGLFPLAMNRVGAGDQESRATFHAQAKIEELKSVAWDDLTELTASDSVDVVYERNWEVHEDEPVMGMKEIEVTVTWRDNKGPRTVALSSYLSDSGI